MRASARSLSAIAARAQLGDRAALEDLLRQLQQPIGEHIRGIVRNDDLAADALQESLIIVCRRLGTVRDTNWVRAWAYRVATREALRALQRARRDQGEPLDDPSLIPNHAVDESAADLEELIAELPAKLAALPAAAQTVLRLRYLQSLTQQEIAEALEIPIGTVKSRIAYGLTWLRREWRPRDA